MTDRVFRPLSAAGLCLVLALAASCGDGDGDDGGTPGEGGAKAPPAPAPVPEEAAPAPGGTFLPVRINVAGPNLEVEGQKWTKGETFSKGGNPFRFDGTKDTLNLAAAAPARVYDMVRHRDHAYAIPGVPPGRYRVRLHFLEGIEGERRRMEVRVNGQLLIDAYDPGSVAGALNTAAIEDLVVDFEGGGSFRIAMAQGDGSDAFVAGIELFPAAADTPLSQPPRSVPPVDPAERQGAPEELAWLRAACGGHGALAYTDGESLRLTELATGATEIIGSGIAPEFSPDGSRLAWIDGDRVIGRNRKGKTGAQLIARGALAGGGVHWLDDETVVALFGQGGARHWAAVSLGGGFTCLPELDALGTGIKETDVRRRADGGWSYVSERIWRTADGSGHIGGGCAPSLSPDGKTTTALLGGHQVCKLNALYPDAHQGSLRWHFAGGFDNLRWASNDARFITAVEETSDTMVVLAADSSATTKMGEAGAGHLNMYGDFTVGEGIGADWPPRKGPPPGAGAIIAAGKAARPDQPAEVTATNTDWPGRRDRLIFLWDNNAAENQVQDLQSGRTRTPGGSLGGAARFDAHHALDLRGGSYTPDNIARELREQTIEATQFWFEATVRADEPGLSRGTVVAFGDGKAPPNFALEDLGGELWWTFRSDAVKDLPRLPAWRLGPLEPGRYHHVLVTWKPNEMVGYLDGERSFHTNQLGGNVWCWTQDTFVIGKAPWDKDAGWWGRCEAISVGDRYLDPGQARQRYELATARREGREDPPRFLLEGALVESTTTPPPEEIAPYTRCLVEALYDVRTVVEGELESPQVLVLRWGILGGKPVALSREPGSLAALELEPVSAHPELKFERRVGDILAIGVPVFVDVGGGPPPLPPSAP